MSRPDLPWTGDVKGDRAIADRAGYRHLTLRDLSKRLGHGTNFFGQPVTMAKHTQLPVGVVEDFQRAYFAAFPAIPKWHAWVVQELAMGGSLTTLFGRRRYFMGRRDDDSTIRKAIAFEPQSMTAEEINIALLRIFREDIVHLHLQVHDSIVGQYPAKREAEIIPQLLACFHNPITIHDREFVVPADAQVGWNLNEVKTNKATGEVTNPYGLLSYKAEQAAPRRAPVRKAYHFLDGV